jgi:hypothetical protein
MFVMGIDIGLKGFCCFINERNQIELFPNPVVGNQIDVLAFNNLVHQFMPDCIFMERPQVRPEQGARSALTTGINFGIMIAVVNISKISAVAIDPKTWQAIEFLGTPSHLEPKDRSAMAAQRLFPGVEFRDSPRCKKLNDNRTDAALIAHFGLISLGKETAASLAARLHEQTCQIPQTTPDLGG